MSINVKYNLFKSRNNNITVNDEFKIYSAIFWYFF